MIAVDTNILVYAHRAECDFHDRALTALTGLAEGTQPWAIPWPCVHEFLAIVTHPRIYVPPSPPALALQALSVWIDSPTCRLIGEGPRYMAVLERLVVQGGVRGPVIHDARIAALCLHHGVTLLWTADRDFGRFKDLKTGNPLV